MVIGQTPGLTEYRTGRPFQGQAGKGIRGELSKLGVHEFDRYVFSSAVAKCFPGRKHRKANDPSSKCEDRQPPATMVNNCRLFLKRQVDLADPSIIITLGSTALKAYLEMSGQHVPAPRLENYVGKTEGWGKRIVVFFPHTSGSARWLNAHSNKLLFDKAKNLLRIALLERGVLNA
ncbi:uracil-DNA glycosylase family protein [Thiocystis violacea]|uniref:uracil-DNA glycosylase family protein n=1 Tax=Thiocystis violacea TaxID=13725 RepID=UPI003B82D980